MFKILLLIFLSFLVFAQKNTTVVQDLEVEEKPIYKYVSLKDNKVYDVELLVFAYRNNSPDYNTFQNKPIFDDSTALNLQLVPKDLPKILKPETVEAPISVVDASDSSKNKSNNPEYTVAIEDEENDLQALVWFEHNPEDYKLTSIWKRLIAKDNIVPLVHKAWRQVGTPFRNPTYVKISNIVVKQPENMETSSTSHTIENAVITNELNIDENGNFINTEMPMENDMGNDIKIQNMLYSDFTLTGMVALSQGRFMHFGHKLNLFRTYNTDENKMENIIFSLVERKQLRLGELNYFDSPWLGSIVKITRFTGEKK